MTTELGNEVRAEVARILKRFGDCDLAGVRVETLKRIDAYLNPEPDTFRIPTERTDARPYELMSANRLERLAGGAL